MKFWDNNWDKITSLNHLEQKVLDEFNTSYALDPDSKPVIKIVQDTAPYLVTKFALANDNFKQACKQAIHNQRWESLWHEHGKLLIPNHGFGEYKPKCYFERFLGVNLFNWSRQLRKSSDGKCVTIETRFLQKAIEYNSIHALLRYCELTYQAIDQGILLNYAEKLTYIIDSCKKTTPYYGSFAYMMLSEAYYRFYQLYMDLNFDLAENFHNAALKCCRHAETILEASQYSIHNASLGQGLPCSNTLKLNSPAAAIQFIEARSPSFIKHSLGINK